MDEEALPLPVRMGLWIYVLGLIAYMTFFWIASESVAHKPENIDRWKKWRFFVDAFVFAGVLWVFFQGFKDESGEVFLYITTGGLIAALSFYFAMRSYIGRLRPLGAEMKSWARSFGERCVGVTLLSVWLYIYLAAEPGIHFIHPEDTAHFIVWPVLSALCTLAAFKTKYFLTRAYAAAAAIFFFIASIAVYVLYFVA